MYKTKPGLDGGSVRLRGGFDCTIAFGPVLGADHNKQLFKFHLIFNVTPLGAPTRSHLFDIFEEELVPVLRNSASWSRQLSRRKAC